MFSNSQKSFTNEDLLIQCCDTALDDLTDEKVSNDLDILEKNGYIKKALSVPDFSGSSKYSITGKGILYVRKDMLKPIQDFVQRDNVEPIVNYVKNPVMDTFVTLKNDTISENDGKFDKRSFNSKIVDYAINNVRPVVNAIPKIIEALGTFS